MSEKDKKNPLLDDEQGESSAKSEKPVKAEKAAPAEATPAAPKDADPVMAKVKAEAVKLFPKDLVKQTKHILDNSPHVNFIVPKIEGEIGYEEVQINGYKLTIQRNVMVSIPVQVAAVLAEKYRINFEAGKEKRVDRASDVTEALG